MNYSEVVRAAKALIAYTGPDSRPNDLSDDVKARVLNAHTWEQFFAELDVTYTGGSEFVDLDTNAYRAIHRIIAMRIESDNIPTPEYVTPGEYNRLVQTNWASLGSIRYWTQIGRELRVLGRPDGNKTLTVTYMPDAGRVGWGDIPNDFLDYSATILARMLTPIQTTTPAGNVTANPAFVQLIQLENNARRDLIRLEYRRPGRDYKVREDGMRTIRNEQYDY